MSNLFWYEFTSGDISNWTQNHSTAGSYQINASTATKDQYNTVEFALSSGAYQWCGYDINFSSQDWSDWNALNWFWYGQNSGEAFRMEVFCPDNSNKLRFDNTDNTTDITRKSVHLHNPDNVSGSPDYTDVTKIRFLIDTNVIGAAFTIGLGRVWVSRYGYDVPRWST